MHDLKLLTRSSLAAMLGVRPISGRQTGRPTSGAGGTYPDG